MGIVQRELAIHVVGSGQRDPIERRSDAMEQRRRKRTRRPGHLGKRRPAVDVHEVGEIDQAIEVRQDDPRRREPGIVRGIPERIGVVSEFHIVIAFDPPHGVRQLEAAFVDGVEDAEVVPERQVVRNVQIRLACRAWKVVLPPGELHQERVDELVRERRIQRRDHGLVRDEQIPPAARRANAAAILRVAHQLIQGIRAQNVVPNREEVPVVGVS